ncbi:hypothetical protein [Streptomyces leeuwenhoekii]|uniref:Uncharacterized protein n=1 Tax=Streptomyces leeuwenhoekii TaxID=1437453 RepID=A0A0F7VRT2_STRLW|nr:hypothetical protein [Streptomyces leeuwenhoekii]CQR60222.1 Hypothetical Protein sle_07590 [Streptomyces leeuwenhoekii]
MSPAPVHIGVPSNIIEDYYRFSQRETIGPAQIETGAIRAFATLEGLVDGILASTDSTHVVVCHGNPEQGLLIPFMPGSPHNATGPMAEALADLAKKVAQGQPPLVIDPKLVDAAAKMGVDPAAALRLIGKFALLHSPFGPSRTLHFRACNFGQNNTMLAGYKLLFHTVMVTAPTCRMFYLRIPPGRPGASSPSIPQLAGQQPTTPRTRRRMFGPAPDGTADPLLVDVHDIDGHGRVETLRALLDHPGQGPRWAELLTGHWTNHTAPNFVLPVLWRDTESSFHCPLEGGYRERLTFA